jgi:D-galactarolactone cycloisomerase
MKIVRVEGVPVRLPFKQLGPPIMAFGRPLTAIEFVLIVVETEDGTVGYGETPWGPWRTIKTIVDDFIAPAVVGRDASDIPATMHELQKLVYVVGRYGLTMFAVSGLDTALWDIAGKRAGVPLYRLFGGTRRKLPGYSSLWVRYKKTGAWSWESEDPDVLAERTRAAVAAGYRYIKLHGTAESDLRIARDNAGSDVRMMIDASCRWTPAQAREAALKLRQFDPYWLEEPIFPPEDFGSLARLQVETGVPIAAGENACTAYEFAAMFAARAVTYAQPNVNRVGGVTELRKVATLAEQHGVELCPHSFIFGPGFLATLHLLSAQPRGGLVEKAGLPLEVTLYGSAAEPVDGHFEAPDGPGLGCEPDPDVLKECRIQGA